MKGFSKAITLVAGLLMVGLLASCMTEQEKKEATELATQKASCAETGGRWGRGGIMGLEQCFPNYKDGGKSCTKASDCSGMCLSDTRTCAPTFYFGCQAFLNENGEIEEICID